MVMVMMMMIIDNDGTDAYQSFKKEKG